MRFYAFNVKTPIIIIYLSDKNPHNSKGVFTLFA